MIRRSLRRQLTLSSELVPFQEIDVYAKEAGYVKKLYVDYGTRVRAGQVMATLEIPELQAQLEEDQAEIKNASDVVARAQYELRRYQAQYKVLHLEYTRLNGVFQSQPGIVAQQEVDDAQGKDLAAASQVDAGEAALQAAQSSLNAAKAKLLHDQTLYLRRKITLPPCRCRPSTARATRRRFTSSTPREELKTVPWCWDSRPPPTRRCFPV